MTETELIFQISNIVNGRVTFPQAVEQIALLVEPEIGHPDAMSYEIDLRDGGQTLGTVMLKVQGTLPQPLADFVGQQLGMLLARTRLAERRSQLRSEIAATAEDLATRKLMQRAEGILIARRVMSASAAKRWIAQQSRKTGLSKNDVADRIIAYYQATGLLEQRIA